MEIFISYRRADSAEFAGRIHKKMIGAFGNEGVFRDIDDILAGRDFRFALQSITKNCNVMLVIIGPKWTEIMKERSTNPIDWVRFEVETGLNRKDILVIPVLANGAAMPSVNDLPPTLIDLPNRNGVFIKEGNSFDRDVEKLILAIKTSGYERINGKVSAGFSLYADSDSDSKIIARISRGTEVTRIEQNRDRSWSHLLINDNLEGWAANEDFTLISDQLTQSVKEIPIGTGFGAKSNAWQLYFTAPTGEPNSTNKDLGIDARLADAITRSKSSLDIAAFEFNNNVLTEAILEAKERGLSIRIVADLKNGIERDGNTFGQFAEAGIPIRTRKGAKGLMHNKFMILDGRVVWTGSWNYTQKSTYNNNENSLVFEASAIAEIYKKKFEEMFNEGKFGSMASKNSFHTLSVAGVPIEICFTPNATIEQHIGKTILSAKKSIHFMMFSFTNRSIGAAMRECHGKGIPVFGLLEKIGSNSKISESRKMVEAGLEIRFDCNPYFLHHKVIIIDEAIVITGSMNLTQNGIEVNDENVIIVRDPVLAKVYLEEFNRQWVTSTLPTDKQKKSRSL